MSGSTAIILAPTEAVQHRISTFGAGKVIMDCYAQLKSAETVQEIVEVLDTAAAIDAVTQKLRASDRVRRAAILLRIEAEQQLGLITGKVPQAARGKKRKDVETGTGKKAFLKSHGITGTRANKAEKLAEFPKEEIEMAIEKAPLQSFSGIQKYLGVINDNYVVRNKHASDLAFLAEEAITLLDSCVKGGKFPHAGTVREYQRRLAALKGQTR